MSAATQASWRAVKEIAACCLASFLSHKISNLKFRTDILYKFTLEKGISEHSRIILEQKKQSLPNKEQYFIA